MLFTQETCEPIWDRSAGSDVVAVIYFYFYFYFY